MNLNQNYLLLIMLISYCIPIVFVYYRYNTYGAQSISSIITGQEPLFTVNDADSIMNTLAFNLFQTRHLIAGCMLIMAAFTILYEYQRCKMYMNSQLWSLFTIIILLLGIFGVIYIPETNSLHYVFGAAAFFAIIGFMVGHTYHHYSHSGHTIGANLRIILYMQILFMVITVLFLLQNISIFVVEALFLANFAAFYLYIHFHNFSNSISHSSR